MKKYGVGLLLLLVMHNVCAMELAKLSPEDDAKALRFAKLFNKYPQGYGQTDEDKKKIVCKMDCFAQDAEYAPLYSCVKKYQSILNNDQKLPREVKSHIFTQALWDDATQYYAISNALRLMIISSTLAWNGFYSSVMDWYRPCFVAELHEDDNVLISFSDHGDDDARYPSDDSIVRSQCRTYQKDCRWNGRECQMTSISHDFEKKTIKKLTSFIHEDTIKARVGAFKEMFASWVECLANPTNTEKSINMFVELLGLLKEWQYIELGCVEDCEEVLKTEDKLKNISSNFIENSVCLK